MSQVWVLLKTPGNYLLFFVQLLESSRNFVAHFLRFQLWAVINVLRFLICCNILHDYVSFSQISRLNFLPQKLSFNCACNVLFTMWSGGCVGHMTWDVTFFGVPLVISQPWGVILNFTLKWFVSLSFSLKDDSAPGIVISKFQNLGTFVLILCWFMHICQQCNYAPHLSQAFQMTMRIVNSNPCLIFSHWNIDILQYAELSFFSPR